MPSTIRVLLSWPRCGSSGLFHGPSPTRITSLLRILHEAGTSQRVLLGIKAYSVVCRLDWQPCKSEGSIHIMSEPGGMATSTPEHTPKSPNPTVRRSHTVPTRFTEPVRTIPSAVPGADNVETLFVHPQAKIVSFTVSKVPSRPSSSSGTVSSETGALPWTSPTERTLATGEPTYRNVALPTC